MDRPNLELPQRVAVARPILDRRGVFFLAVSLAGFASLAWLITRQRPGGASIAAAPGGTLSATALERVAMRLEDKNLPSAAAEAWSEYLRVSGATEEQRTRVHLRIGRLMQSAGRFEEAIDHYYRAEALAGDRKELLGEDLPLRIRDCFRELGRYGELAREVAERASIDAKPGDLSGRQVVAEIGPEKITVADLDRMVSDEIESMAAAAMGASPEQVARMRREAAQQLGRPETRTQLLQQVVMRRVLAREARERKLDQSAAYRERLARQSDALLADELTRQIAAERATVTPQDVERYFAANAKRYESKAEGRLARIVCASRDDAQKVVELLDGGAAFDKLAKEKSADAATRAAGGLLEEPIRGDDAVVPGVGEDPDLHKRLWALAAGEYTRDPIEVDGAWHVYHMASKRDARLPTLQEIREQVEADCRQARRNEVLMQYVQEVARRHAVSFNPAAVTSRPGTESP